MRLYDAITKICPSSELHRTPLMFRYAATSYRVTAYTEYDFYFHAVGDIKSESLSRNCSFKAKRLEYSGSKLRPGVIMLVITG